MQKKVQDTNALARQRVAASRLKDLVSAGRRDIASGQKRIDDMLNRILGRQDVSIRVRVDVCVCVFVCFHSSACGRVCVFVYVSHVPFSITP
jgi:hypothetical protein